MTINIKFLSSFSLIFGMYLFLATFTVLGQTVTETFATGSWIGAIKMGETYPRLVFHIASDSIGNLTGTVGSPDKGIKGIPLSKVYVSGDSIVLEISAALASFKGVFSNENKPLKEFGKRVKPFIL